MENNLDIEELFNEHQETFTIYVVEQRFANDKGRKFFNGFKGTENFISSEVEINKFINKITNWLGKNVPNLKNLVTDLLLNQKRAALNEIVLMMSQTFTTYNHQAVGPDVIDPIIIQEGKISKKRLNQLVNLHQYSILQPTIIIILKDNNFNRAKNLLQFCPNGMNIKFICNSGKSTIYKVINKGVDNINLFINMFVTQCFSTCSHTQREILFSEELRDESIISYYTPLMFKIRSKLLYDEKESCKADLNDIIENLSNIPQSDERFIYLINCFLCLAKLNRVFCNDSGTQDILDALTIAKEYENNILLAHVYRYAHFLPQTDESEQIPLLKKAQDIFIQNGMIDHALYCENNELILQFNSNKIRPRNFKALSEKAVNDVHGLVGISHIYNNTGVAYLLSGNPYDAIDNFKRGYELARKEDRTVQRLAIQVNILVAESYSLKTIDRIDIIFNMRQIFDSMGKELPYLSACFVLNLLAIADKQIPELYNELLELFPIERLLQLSLYSNMLSSGPLILQLKTLYEHNHNFDIINRLILPDKTSRISGRRAEFIKHYGYNPFIFYVWI